MYWGLNETWWQELWGGLIGSFVAAVLGGLVALLVVRLTNRQQKRGAEEARETAAIADLVAIANGFVHVQPKAKEADITEFRTSLQAALVRLRLASGRMSEMYEALEDLPHLMSMIAIDYTILRKAKEQELADECREAILGAASAIVVSLPNFFEESSSEKRATLRVLEMRVNETREIQKEMGGRTNSIVEAASTEDETE